MIPRFFYWIADILGIGIAFSFSYMLAPTFANWLAGIQSEQLARAGRFLSAAMRVGVMPDVAHLMWVLVVMAAIAPTVCAVLGGYAPPLKRTIVRLAGASAAAALTGTALIAMVAFAIKEQTLSRLFIFSFCVSTAVSMTGLRLAVRYYFSVRRASGYYIKNVVIIGETGVIHWMQDFFTKYVNPKEYRLFGMLRPVDSGSSAESATGLNTGEPAYDIPRLGNTGDLGNLLVHNPINEVIVVQPANGAEWVRKVVEDCDYFGVLLRIVPAAVLPPEYRNFRSMGFDGLDSLPAVVLAPRFLNTGALFIKRMMDIVISGSCLIILLPVFLIIAVAIKLTTRRLPVIYSYTQVGFHGAKFIAYKFTTMVRDAESLKPELMRFNEMQGPVFKMANDPRVTPLGRFLRKYSLNELPQLWNVFRGDLSLVGPRAALPGELEKYDFRHKRKLCVRPGLTCLWQIGGRNKICDFEDWVRLDLQYIDNWSLAVDIRILIKTAWVVVRGSGS